MKVACHLLFVFLFAAGGFGQCDDAQCMKWALRRIIGNNGDILQEGDVTNPTTYVTPGIENRGGNRPGKRGSPGSPGERGPPGPPGVCDCVPEEVRMLQKENALLKERIQRIILTSPETFCLLGMKDRSIPDNSITVSTNEGQKVYARLDDGRRYGWYPHPSRPVHMGEQWIMVDLGKVRRVTGVVTQGGAIDDDWVKSYKVEHSYDSGNFTDVTNTDGTELIFGGNSDRHTKVVNRFPEPVMARYVRIYPMSYQDEMCIRFDIIDC